MGFVTVQHKDGREAQITAGEVVFYKTIGFTPVTGSVIEDAGGAQGQEEPGSLQAPASGTDQRLDLILDELRGLRSDWAATFDSVADDELEPADGETIELREPEKPASDDAPDAGPSLEWSRPDLDAYAAGKGISDADKLPNKQAVLDAIAAAA